MTSIMKRMKKFTFNFKKTKNVNCKPKTVVRNVSFGEALFYNTGGEGRGMRATYLLIL
jgi:hypothetical protein